MTGKRNKLWVAAVLMLLAGILCGCGKKASQEDQQLLLDHMERYLAVTEGMQTQMFAVLDSVEEFTEDNSWDSLLKARTACFSAKRYFQELTLPEFTLTDQQYEALIAAGIEADAMRMEYNTLQENRVTCMDTVNSVTAMLQTDVFLSANVSMFPQLIESYKASTAAISEYTCLAVNYLLLQLDDHGLWEEMPEEYPCISEKQGPWDDDPSSIIEKCADVLDQYEGHISETVAYAAASEYTISILKEANSTGDLERLAKQMHTVEGVPGYIPMPDWLLGDEKVFYCVNDAGTGETRLVEAGETVTQTPCSCYISCGKISREDVESYVEILSEWGFNPYVTEEDGAYQAFFTRGESAFLVEWEEDKTVLYLKEPILSLIYPLYYAAMQQK